jgi:hypothetical protein
MARTIFDGQGLMYLALIAATAVILIMAANTAFAGFPRLGALQAEDGYLPRQLTYRGSRLVYSKGILALAVIASGLIILFQASVTRLIPLYAIGVFLSFTLSQTGMARRWFKSGRLPRGTVVQETGSTLSFDRRWLLKMIVNGFGAVCTFVVMIVFAVTKFRDGAWIVVILIPILVTIFFAIHRHYRSLAGQLSLENGRNVMRASRNRVIIPISTVHQGTLAALRYARTLSDDITAVHISIDEQETEKVQAKWSVWGDGYRLVILNSPYRLLVEPLLEYVARVEALRRPNEVITLVVPQFVPRKWWATYLHTRTAETLRKVLLNRQDIVIVEVPYHVK